MRAQSPPRGRRRAGCRPHSPAGRRTALRPTHRDTCCARGARRASRASCAACEQQQRSVAAAVLGERDLGLEQIHAGAPELVERPGLRGRQQPASHIERPRPQAGLGGGERSVGAPRGIAGQRDRALQECGRGGEAAARLRPARRELELARDLLVGPRRRGGQVPRAAIRIDVAVGGLRQREVGGPALRRRRRPVDGRAHQRMAEGHALADRQQPVRRVDRGEPDPEPLACALQEQRIADRLRRRDAAAAAARRRGAPRAAGRSSPRSAPSRSPALRQRRTRRPAASVSGPGAARAARAGCPASRRGSGRGPARPARTRTAEPSSARASPLRRPRTLELRQRAGAPRRAPARRTRARPARPAAGGRRTRASAPRPDPATARRRRRRAADAARPPRRAG